MEAQRQLRLRTPHAGFRVANTTMSSSPNAGTMSRQLHPNVLPFFARALKTFQLSKATFGVLCSLTPSQCAPEPAPRPPSRVPRSLLVLDSSFNPPTLAHQRMALSALGEAVYASESRVLLLLAINNADKAPKPAAFPQRFAMMYFFAMDLLEAAREKFGAGEAAVDIAVTTEPYFHSKSDAIAACDFYKGTETSDALSGMQQVYLTGFDTLIRIFDPKYYPNDSMRQSLDPFFSKSRVRVTMRTDADWGDAKEQLRYLIGLREGKLEEAGGRKEWAEQVEMVECRQDGEVISSTKVRDAVKAHDWEALNKLVAAKVADWIREEGLYREDAG